MKHRYLKEIELTSFECDGQNLVIQSQSEVELPFKVPFSSTTSVILQASAGVTNQVQEGFYLFGFRIR
jgi:ABC-type multidrug transport system permease subunit